jgi:hypothetical protein
MDIIVPNAASKLRWAVAMAKPDDPSAYLSNTEEALDSAVKRMLQAAADLCLAADLSDDGDMVSHYINGAIHLRDLANSLGPAGHEWPKDGAAIYDFKTKQRVN